MYYYYLPESDEFVYTNSLEEAIKEATLEMEEYLNDGYEDISSIDILQVTHEIRYDKDKKEIELLEV